MIPILLAPLQGYTDFIYRQNHEKFMGGIKSYYTPFLRIEKGGAREKDLEDLKRDEGLAHKAIPQIIFNSVEEFEILVKAVESLGYQEIDLNMGCPFPMQALHGRGSGILPHLEILKEITNKITNYKHLQFSIKMRLGQNNAEESLQLIPLLNSIPLKHITLHPRLGTQQYKGALDEEHFQEFYQNINHPVVFNGDVLSLSRIQKLEAKYPKLAGIMIGRGILAKPYLAAEYASNTEWSPEKRMQTIQEMHQGIYQQSKEVLQDSNQILNRLRSFWEYQTDILPSKIHKQIMKCRSLANYESLIPSIF